MAVGTCIWSCGHNIYFFMLFQTSCQLVVQVVYAKVWDHNCWKQLESVWFTWMKLEWIFSFPLDCSWFSTRSYFYQQNHRYQFRSMVIPRGQEMTIPFLSKIIQANQTLTIYLVCWTLTRSRICYMHAAKFNQLMCTYILMLLRCYHSYCCLSSKTKLARYRF